MILINIYGIIKPTVISKKLGVGINNPNQEWIEGFCDDEFIEERLIHNHEVEVYRKDDFDVSNLEGKYNLSRIINYFGWNEPNKTEEEIIAAHLVEIQVSDFNNSLLQMKNDCLDSPDCEMQYTKKFIRFCRFIALSEDAQKIIKGDVPFITYDSDDYFEKPLILNYLNGMINPVITLQTYTTNCINALLYLGKLIDNYIDKNEEFWLLDYIINALSVVDGDNAYHIFKVMSLIEMLIINPNNHGRTSGEMERKLPQFLWEIDSSKEEDFSKIMRKLRNKIGHGDFKKVQELLEEYRSIFMVNFKYDDFEHSVESWTYGNICMYLDKALANILWLMLYDREKLKNIQMS